MKPSKPTQCIPDIDGSVLRSAREARHFSQEQLARLLCLSVKQLHQLENDGDSCFFSLNHRYQVALKVANYLGLQPVDVCVNQVELMPEATVHDVEKNSSRVDHNEMSHALEQDVLLKGAKPQLRETKFLPRLGFAFALVGLMIGFYQLSELLFKQDIALSTVQAPVLSDDIDQTAVSASNLLSGDICDVTKFGVVSNLSVDAPVKKGDNVLVVAKLGQSICVIDGLKKVSLFKLDADGKQVIVGVAPFTINSNNINNLEIYFQGRRVILSSQIQAPIQLTETLFADKGN